MAIINATPHAIKVISNDGEVNTFEPSGSIARVQTEFATSSKVANFGTFTIKYGEIGGLPEINEGDFIIVSALVLEAAKAASHPLLKQMLAPATGHAGCTRNEKGHIQDVPGFVRA